MNDTIRHIFMIREGGLSHYKNMKKKEIWSVAKALIDNPALGLVYKAEDDNKFYDELRRIVNLFYDPELPDSVEMVKKVGENLSFETFLVLNQFLYNYLSAMVESASIITSRPGEIEVLSEEMLSISNDDRVHLEESKVDINIILLSELLQLVVGLAQAHDELQAILKHNDQQS